VKSAGSSFVEVLFFICINQKIELWYQILAFCGIAGMIYLGRLAQPIFENPERQPPLAPGRRRDSSAHA